MYEVRCPNCGKLLFKANIADLEVKCSGKCRKLVKIKFYSRKALLLTAENKTASIN